MKHLRCLRAGAFGVFALMGACSSGKDTAARATNDANEAPERGGTLRILATSDVDHLSTSSAYTTMSMGFLRTTTRQLVAYPGDADWAKATQVVADLATAVPTRENGGISADGKTYTFHMRRDAMWNTQPPRPVTVQDELRGMKLLCNPVSPTGAPAYYRSTIVGMSAYCDAFAKVKGEPAEIRRFVETHELAGIRMPDDSTIVFTLLQPAVDFLNLITLPFTSPQPVEYLDYVPDGPEFRTHTISNGPYQITRYVPNREIVLARNPAWTAASDPVRKAYVDAIEIRQGVSAMSMLQEMQAGSADLSYDHMPEAAEIQLLLSAGDAHLSFDPSGDAYFGDDYIVINFQSPNERGALRNLKVRQALQYAVDRRAFIQVRGGDRVSRPLYQASMAGSDGYAVNGDRYAVAGDRGDPAKAKHLLAEAGYPNGLTLTLLAGAEFKSWAQTLQASCERAGIHLRLQFASWSDFFAKFLQNPEMARRGAWDLGLTGWLPDWAGTNGRAMISPLFDGRTYGPNSMNYGAYNSPRTNAMIDSALAAATADVASRYWQTAAAHIMDDAAIVPLDQGKNPSYHSARVRNCLYEVFGYSCGLTELWLKGGAKEAKR